MCLKPHAANSREWEATRRGGGGAIKEDFCLHGVVQSVTLLAAPHARLPGTGCQVYTNDSVQRNYLLFPRRVWGDVAVLLQHLPVKTRQLLLSPHGDGFMALMQPHLAAPWAPAGSVGGGGSMKAFGSVWRGLLCTHNNALWEAVAESTWGHTKPGTGEGGFEVVLPSDSFSPCRPPRNLDSRTFITIGDKVRVDVLVSNSACLQYGSSMDHAAVTTCQIRSLWSQASFNPQCVLPLQPHGLQLWRGGMRCPQAGPFPCWLWGCAHIKSIRVTGTCGVRLCPEWDPAPLAASSLLASLAVPCCPSPHPLCPHCCWHPTRSWAQSSSPNPFQAA